MGSFAYKLEHEDGTPADPPSFQTSVPDVATGRHHSVGPRPSLHVIDTREGGDGAVLVVEDA